MRLRVTSAATIAARAILFALIYLALGLSVTGEPDAEKLRPLWLWAIDVALWPIGLIAEVFAIWWFLAKYAIAVCAIGALIFFFLVLLLAVLDRK